MEKQLYSITEAGELIGRRKSAAYAMVAAGELETVSLGGQRMVPATAVRSLVDRLRAEARTDGVNRLLALVDEAGQVDVSKIPEGVTSADLAAVKRMIQERGVPDEAA